jgi:hypothetical protein
MTDLATDRDQDDHCKEDTHQCRVKMLYGLQQSVLAMHCAMVQNRMDAEMPDPSSRIPIQLEMYWGLLNCHKANGLSWRPTGEATAMVDEYVLKQRMSLLELAAWKAMCLVSSAGATTPDCSRGQDWRRHGWKVNKSATRNSNEIGIILRTVLPFIG